jgi:hypothetical protein
MSNPTSNFNWQMPTATNLVSQLPADFEVFGQAVDTDFADLLGGTTGQVLSKTSATDLDFTWITTGGLTLLSTTSLSGASTTVSSISAAYTDLRILVIGAGNATADGKLSVKFNGSSVNTSATWLESGTAYSVQDSFFATNSNQTRTATNILNMTFNIYNYQQSLSPNLARTFDGVVSYYGAGAVKVGGIGGFIYDSAAISSVTVANAGGSFNAGSILIYGVK